MKGGTWYGNCGNIRFYETKDSWWVNHNMGLPSGQWKFKNNVYKIGDVDCLYIMATGKNTIVIEYVKDGRQYTMTRR
jgi:hypothetical protein